MLGGSRHLPIGGSAGSLGLAVTADDSCGQSWAPIITRHMQKMLALHSVRDDDSKYTSNPLYCLVAKLEEFGVSTNSRVHRILASTSASCRH